MGGAELQRSFFVNVTVSDITGASSMQLACENRRQTFAGAPAPAGFKRLYSSFAQPRVAATAFFQPESFFARTASSILGLKD